MGWKFWRREPAVAAVSTAIVALEMTLDGRLQAHVSLPQPQNEAEAHSLASNLALMIVLLSQGKLLPTLQQAVAGAGTRQQLEAVSSAVLSGINQLSIETSRLDAASDLCVPPAETFSFRQGVVSDD